MKVTLTRSHQNPPEIRQLRPRREWMDGTYNKHAYKCPPLTRANVHGWEILLPCDVSFIWEGGNTVPKVIKGGKKTYTTPQGQEYERDILMPSVIGAMSFTIGWAITTPPGFSVWMSAPPNSPVPGLYPMTAMIPGWWPDEVNMNYICTTPNKIVTMSEGEPFMYFQIVDDSFLEEVEFDVVNMWDDPELMASRQSYSAAKMKKMQDEPWTWMGGLRTGLNEKGEQIGPALDRHPSLEEPKCPFS